MFGEHKIAGGEAASSRGENPGSCGKSPGLIVAPGSGGSECSLTGQVLTWEAAGQPRGNVHQLKLLYSS